jgi:hypothetical protein
VERNTEWCGIQHTAYTRERQTADSREADSREAEAMQWNFGGGGMGGHGGRMPAFFESQYCCSSTAMAGKDVDDGDKIFLPPSALDKLARMNVEYPMLFEVCHMSYVIGGSI